MRQVVTLYKTLKIMENYKTVSPKGGRGRLREVLIYERFYYYKALTKGTSKSLNWLAGPGVDQTFWQ